MVNTQKVLAVPWYREHPDTYFQQHTKKVPGITMIFGHVPQ